MSRETLALQNQILALLPEQRAELYRALDLEVPSALPQTWQSRAVYQAIAQHTAMPCEPLGVFLVRHTKFKKVWNETVEAFMLAVRTPKPLSEPRVTGLIGLAAKSLADDLCARKIPVTLSTMCLQRRRLPVALDSAFPGYAAAGRLEWLVPVE